MKNLRNISIIIIITSFYLGIAESTIAQTTVTPGTTEVDTQSSTQKQRSDGLRRWNAADSVAVRHFDPEQARISPDGSRFFIVSRRGDLSCDCAIYELSIFVTADVQRALTQAQAGQRVPPSPIRRLVRRSGGYRTFAIFAPEWEGDDRISFIGVDERGVLQAYRFDVTTGNVTALTHETREVNSMVRNADTVISNVLVPWPEKPAPYPAHVVTRRDMLDVFVGGDEKSRLATVVWHRGSNAWELTDSNPQLGLNPTLSLDGRKAIAFRSHKDVSASWAEYERLGDIMSLADEHTFFARPTLIDLENQIEKPLFDAPIGLAVQMGSRQILNLGIRALWAEDQRNVILVNTALPLDAGKSPERARTAYIVSVDTETGAWAELEPLESVDPSTTALRRVTEVGWLTPGKELLIGHEIGGKPAAGTVYSLKNGRWIGQPVNASVKLSKPAAPTLAGELTVTLRQGMNEPPVFVASDGRRELALTEPDSALKGVWWARTEPFEWRLPNGKKMTGGLLMPRDAGKGPVPLVIQSYNYSPTRFETEGPARHAYAAQALVARGIAVLNIDIPQEDVPRNVGTPAELIAFVERINAAADALASKGMIDRARVGLVGFSRGGYNTYYAITHPRGAPPAAAVIDDAFSGSYPYYLFGQAVFGTSGGFDRQYDGSFWQNKSGWLEHAPGFNIDRVETPALFTMRGTNRGAFYSIETIGAFSLNRRPIEVITFPYAGHQIHLPRQRLASIEATTEWMAFWLLGEMPSDPERAARWKELRTQQEAVLAAATAKGKKRASLPPLIPARQSSTAAAKQN